MSDVNNTPAPPEPGVMGSLPKTRPQHPSARRKTAQRKPTKRTPAPARASAPVPARASTPAPSRTSARTSAPAPAELPRAPKQGFEAESEVELGKTVHPPGGAELAASVVELFGELAQTGLSGGGKLLKDALSRLSGS
jgi:hypothetical protein